MGMRAKLSENVPFLGDLLPCIWSVAAAAAAAADETYHPIMPGLNFRAFRRLVYACGVCLYIPGRIRACEGSSCPKTSDDDQEEEEQPLPDAPLKEASMLAYFMP